MHTPKLAPPAPNVLQSIRADLSAQGLNAIDRAAPRVAAALALEPMHRPGFNDGTFYAPTVIPAGAPNLAMLTPSAASRSRPKTGTQQILVLMVDFSDNPGTRAANTVEEMLFSQSTYATGSMRDFYQENSYGTLDVTGQVYGWLRMPQTYAYYVNANNGTGSYPRNAQRMAEDAVNLAISSGIDLAQFDGDGDAYVDGLFIIHAGGGAEADPNPATRNLKVWSHQWTMTGPITMGGVTAYSYLTIPEDAKVGVCAHEFGHMLGLPDLYDTTYRSSGVGDWCVMGGGSWNNGGDTPSHFCAWSKAFLGWVQPQVVGGAQSLTLAPVESSANDVYRVWTRGNPGPEYFLLENRRLTGFDSALPGEGLLIWHVDETQPDNTRANSYLDGLEQADGQRDLQLGRNQGDGGDPYPGTAGAVDWDDTTSPNSRDNAGNPTNVAVTGITASGQQIQCHVSV